MMRNKILPTASAVAFFVAAGMVNADDASSAVSGAQAGSISSPAITPTVTGRSDDSLTILGVTMYGAIDAGYAYQTHGTPFNKDYSSGLEYSIQKNSNKSVSAFAPNGLGQSNIGLKGEMDLIDGLSGLFKIEGGFDPLSLRLANGPASLVSNNGISLKNQSSNGDSSRAGQIFNSAAYAGVKSKDYGTLTYGRQVTLQADNVIKYDPNTVSCAFSVIGCSGTAQGIGDKQNGRLDSSMKFTNKFGRVRFGALYQFAGKQLEFMGADGVSGSAEELAVGSDFGNFSADLIYSHKNDAISAAALPVAGNSLSATVSDNISYALMGKYKTGSASWYAGYEHVRFANPSSPLLAGSPDAGGYTLSTVNNTAYTHNKILVWYWAGLKYAVTPKLNLTGTYYGYSQNSYSGNGCANATLTTCSGTFGAESFVATYSLTKHSIVYGGAMWSQAHNGVASGYLYTSTVTTMVGGRVTF